MLVSTCYLNITQNLSRNLRPYALIENVVTLAEHRQRGYGTAVLQVAMEEARSRGCYKVMLMTGSKRESTLRFYEKAACMRARRQLSIPGSPILGRLARQG